MRLAAALRPGTEVGERYGRDACGISRPCLPAELKAAGDGAVDIPPPPYSDASFRLFYERERPKMIALVGAMSGDKIYDPEQTAENGWHRFYPYWKNCDNPSAYLRRCIVNAVWDELADHAR